MVQREVVFSLGSNQGDSVATLQAAVDALGRVEGLTLTVISSVYLTDPVDYVSQPDFHNIVVLGRSALSPLELLHQANRIEQELGRVRLADKGPRTIDIDLIKVGELTSNTARLQLPHPGAARRAFVLVPWAEVDPAAQLPQGRVADLVATVGHAGVKRLSGTPIVLADQEM